MSRGSLFYALRHNYEGRIYLTGRWRFRIGPCCEFHRMTIHIGPFIWRWAA